MRRFPWLLGFTMVLVFCLGTSSGLHFIEIADAQAAQPLTVPMTEPGVAPGWWVQHADAPLTFKNMPPHGMGITTGGVVHVVYGGDHLYHAWKSRGSWYYETVDPAWGVGSFAALAIDSANKLHVSYIDAAVNRLKYATNRNGSWQVETPAIADGLSASNAAIAVDSANDPHIVFSSYDNTLRYGYFDSEYGAWVGSETLATGTGPLNYPGAFALAVGPPFATPHVSYHKHVNASNGTLHYTTRTDPNTWSTSPALALGGDSDGDYNDIALNGGIPHIAASANSPGLYVVRYTFLDGANWHAAEPATTASNAPATAISLRLVGSTPTIAYQDPGVGYYWLSRTGDNNWSAEEAIVTGSAAGNWASFAWYGGYPYATYYDSSTRQFSFKYKTSGGWQAPYTLATNGHQVGDKPSLAVDTLGRSHIVYADTTAMQLLYLRYDGASWYHLPVDTGPVYGNSSLVLENNIPKVLYLGTDGSVRYTALLCAPGCTFIIPEIVDSGLALPMYHPALAIHATTGIHAAYHKNGSLIYARRTGSNAWTKTTVDTGTYAGIAMAVDAGGAPHLMYRKGTNLIHAYLDTAWHTSDIIATSTYFGLENSFRISPQGLKAAVYTSYTGGSYSNVVYATSCALNPCAWVPQTIDASGDEFVDLAFDSSGVPHIAYFSMPGGDLKFAERNGGATWTTKVIDSRGWVGDYLSIAVSPLNGLPRIAYRDFTNEDLKLALEGQLVFLPAVLK